MCTGTATPSQPCELSYEKPQRCILVRCCSVVLLPSNPSFMSNAKGWIPHRLSVHITKGNVEANRDVRFSRGWIKRMAVGQDESIKPNGPFNVVTRQCRRVSRPCPGGVARCDAPIRPCPCHVCHRRVRGPWGSDATENPRFNPVCICLPCRAVVTARLAFHESTHTVASEARLDCVGHHLPLGPVPNHPALVVDTRRTDNRVDKDLHLVPKPRPAGAVQEVCVGVPLRLPACRVFPIRHVVHNVKSHVQVRCVVLDPSCKQAPVFWVHNGRKLLHIGIHHGEDGVCIVPFSRSEGPIQRWCRASGSAQGRSREQRPHRGLPAHGPRTRKQRVQVGGKHVLCFKARVARCGLAMEVTRLVLEALRTDTVRCRCCTPCAHPSGQAIKGVSLVKHGVEGVGQIDDPAAHTEGCRWVPCAPHNQVGDGRAGEHDRDRVSTQLCGSEGSQSSAQTVSRQRKLHRGVALLCRLGECEGSAGVVQVVRGEGGARRRELSGQLAVKEESVGTRVRPSRHRRCIEVGATECNHAPSPCREHDGAHATVKRVGVDAVSHPSRHRAVSVALVVVRPCCGRVGQPGRVGKGLNDSMKRRSVASENCVDGR
eukprot:m.210196 g.210196  ORF g.210196 m.210196 type:complete len:599 (+) comp24906_c0_seq1:97-1893(+)